MSFVFINKHKNSRKGEGIYLGNKRFIFVLKLALIWYLCIFSAGYLTSQTAAYFTDQKQINGVITTGTWESDGPEHPGEEEKEDNSELTFPSNGNQEIEICEPVNIEVKIINEGESDMKRNSSYKVYYIEQGNPKNGEKVKLAEDEGVIPALKQGETTKLTYQASKKGMYMFLAKQSGDQQKENTWSEKIIVHCPPGQETKTNENAEDTKKQKQEQAVEDAEKDSEAKVSIKDKAEDTEEIGRASCRERGKIKE